jgi:hypothetical protein
MLSNVCAACAQVRASMLGQACGWSCHPKIGGEDASSR